MVNTGWLAQFYDIFRESHLYDSKMVEGLKDIINEMDNLREEYMKSSNYEEIKPIEEKIHKKQERYIGLLESL